VAFVRSSDEAVLIVRMLLVPLALGYRLQEVRHSKRERAAVRGFPLGQTLFFSSLVISPHLPSGATKANFILFANAEVDRWTAP